jgi:alpha-tubulin suppressor-like RCC1 family protein
VGKIAAGGYTVAALTTSGSLYVWGRESDGVHRRPQAIPGLTEFPNYAEVGGDRDVKDVALGESHAICLTADNAVFVIGGNDNGQLGLGLDVARVTTWTELALELPAGHECVGVAAGPRSSFILLNRKGNV